MKFRKSELLFIVLVMSEVILIPLIYARLRSGEPLFPAATVVYERDYEILRKGPCVAYQQPYPADTAHQTFRQNVEVIAPDGKTLLCLTVIQSSSLQWKFSPDGQYMLLIEFTHGERVRLFQVSNTKELCWYQFDAGRYIGGINCPILKLADGRWWKGDFPDIFLKTGDPNIWSLVNSRTELSPDKEWMVGFSAGGGYLARTDGKIVTRYSMPYPYGSISANMPPCGYNGYSDVVWRPDSKQFAIVQPGDKNIFIWSIEDNGNVHLDNQTAVEKCSTLLQLTPEGKVITKPIY